ncbi:hypothetical protein V6C42_05240 [Pseudoclostridium thermosuccinogenes]|uniref:hypothetical protein n=1 Tax=Clostridium thermosuccinogenes TaxID=84032 RepID=UPI002FD98061
MYSLENDKAHEYSKGIKADMVVVDPPCKSFEEKLLDAPVEVDLSRIIYVSYNSSTQERELKSLSIRGKYML